MQVNRFRIATIPEDLVPNTAHRRFYFFSLLLVLLMIGVIVFLYKYLPQQIPMFFTEPWGESRLADKNMIGLLPAVPFIIIVVNALTNKLVKDNIVLSQILAASALLSTIMFAVALVGSLQSIL